MKGQEIVRRVLTKDMKKIGNILFLFKNIKRYFEKYIQILLFWQKKSLNVLQKQNFMKSNKQIVKKIYL